MFRNYEEKMEQLKNLSETLINEGIYSSSFLGTLDTAMRYIQGAWESFPESYKQEIENAYVSDVIETMSKAINDYIQNVSQDADAFEKFNSACGVVGRNISLYSGRANSRQSLSSSSHDFSEDVIRQPEDDTNEYIFRHSTQMEDDTLKYTPRSQEQQSPEQSVPFSGRAEETAGHHTPEKETPNPQEVPPSSDEADSEPRQEKKSAPSKKEKRHSKTSSPQNSQTLKSYFFESSPKSASQTAQNFTKTKKCVIFVNFSDHAGNLLCSYGLQKGMTLGKTEVTPDEETKSWVGIRKVYKRYFLTYHYHVRFNHKNFKKMPSLNRKQNDSDKIPLSHLLYDAKGDGGSSIWLFMIPRKEGFQVRCEVETEKNERTDFLSELLNHFAKSESVGIHRGNGENENIVGYDLNGGICLRYELEPKQENPDSPEIKTEIVVYLEF